MKRLLPYIIPLLIGLALLPIPLLRDFHFESAMIAGIIGSYWAGIHSARYQSKQDFFSALRILGFFYLAGIPLFIHAIITGCLTLDGVGFWIFIPFPSVFLGAAIGRLLRKLWVPFPKTLTILIITAIALVAWLFEFFHFPQVYFYNHIWGIWPGPIYDEAVQLSGSFLYFRWLTVLWIVLLWLIPGWDKNLQTKIITGLALLSLLLGYLNLDEAGIISPEERIQQVLGGHSSTEYFELFYAEDFFTEEDIQYWAARHEFYFQEIIQDLDIDWPQGRKIHSFLYAHAWQKKKLTGAKFTSYVPIWLDQDQLHIAKSHLKGVLEHEMVHAISKQFGNRLFNGSWKIGLIEGLAEAVARDASSRSTLHQLVAAEKPWPSADEMKSALSWTGFYSKAGAISYTTTGSFVRYLLDNYPPENLKKAYKGVSFEVAYDPTFSELVSGWHQTLEQTSVDSVDQKISEYIFAQLSLFQKPCPHSITDELRLWDNYQYRLSEKDTVQAYKTLSALHEAQPDNEWVKDEWVRTRLRKGDYTLASQSITPADSLLTLQVLKADAQFLTGNYAQARSHLQSLSSRIKDSPNQIFDHTLEIREDSLQWSWHLNRRYADTLPDSATFRKLNHPNQMLTLRRALALNKRSEVNDYSFLLTEPLTNEWFDLYDESLNKLAFWGEQQAAKDICSDSSNNQLRLRYQERLTKACKWVNFTSTYIPVAD